MNIGIEVDNDEKNLIIMKEVNGFVKKQEEVDNKNIKVILNVMNEGNVFRDIITKVEN